MPLRGLERIGMSGETRVGVEELKAAATGGIADDEREWGLTRSQAVLIAAIPVAFAIVGILAVPFESAYRLLTKEDGIVEWLQVLALVVLFVIYLRLVVELWRSGHRLYAALFVVAAAGVFFIAGEEISGSAHPRAQHPGRARGDQQPGRDEHPQHRTVAEDL